MNDDPRPEDELSPEAAGADVPPDGVMDRPGVIEEEAAPELDDEVDRRQLEAVLFSSKSALSAGKLAEILERPSSRGVRAAVETLNAEYEAAGRAFAIEEVAGGFVMMTRPEFGQPLAKLHQREGDAKLTPAAIETLSIVAYKQPVLRAEVEAIRGVACGEQLRSLMDKHLVKIAGRAEEPGRPILYGTTRRFLEVFGLNSTKDLPSPEGVRAGG